MTSVSRDTMRKIVEAAAAAPSADNSQPWRFVVRGATIEFHYLPEKDNALLNYEEGGTLIALGAAIENAALEACAHGLDPRVTLAESGPCVATIELRPGGALDGRLVPLRDAIPQRHTNRKAYEITPLAGDVRAAIMSRDVVGDAADLTLVESREALRPIARALTTMEEMALSKEALHKLFFKDIFWSDADNRAGEPGLYIRTLELPPPARVLFKVLKYWPVARALARVGFPTKVAEMNAAQNAAASAFGIITSERHGREAYVEAGRLLERVWLLAAARGLSLQIVTGFVFLARSLSLPQVAELFTDAEKERIAASRALIARQVASGAEPLLVFRLGTASAPTDVSYRRAPDLTFAD